MTDILFYELLPKIDIVIIFIFLAICGILIRSTLVFTNQNWAKTYQHAASYILLPIIAYVITTTIANNIALSLGMIGALSIVRFRHPVRSHFELTLFFALITLGIAAGVNYKIAILLQLAIIMTILSLYYLKSIFKTDLFVTSFSDGDIINYIEIEANKKIDYLVKNNYLKSLNCDYSKKEFQYVLSFTDKKTIDNFIQNIENDKNILKYKVNINENNI